MPSAGHYGHGRASLRNCWTKLATTKREIAGSFIGIRWLPSEPGALTGRFKELTGLQVKLRLEQPGDFRAVEEITRNAFWNLYVPGANEHYIVHSLRDHPDYIPELSLVAEREGEVVGSICCTRAHIQNMSGHRHPVLTFGPLSVRPDLFGMGIGRALIEESRVRAAQRRETAICILGYPDYYARFGFVNARRYGISMGDGVYPWALQVLELSPDALAGVEGNYVCSEMFEPDPEKVEQFDASFSYREKFVTGSQKAFEKALGLQDGDPIPEIVRSQARSLERL